MKRRELLAGSIGLLALTKLQPSLAADPMVEFTPELYEEALASGEPFMLGFLSTW